MGEDGRFWFPAGFLLSAQRNAKRAALPSNQTSALSTTKSFLGLAGPILFLPHFPMWMVNNPVSSILDLSLCICNSGKQLCV